MKQRKRIAATLIAALSLMATPLMADVGDIYLELDGQFAIPPVFTGPQEITGIGFGGGGAIGYDLNGWLFGVGYDIRLFPERNQKQDLMQTFTHHLIRVDIGKVFDIVPDTIGLRVGISGGYDALMTDYYKSLSAKKAKYLTSTTAGAAIAGLGVFIEFPVVPVVTPYIGVEADCTLDKSGVFIMPVATVGLRTSLNKINGSGKGDEGLTLEADEEFTPGRGGKSDKAKIKAKLKTPKGDKPDTWKITIYDERGNPFKTFEGSGKPKEVAFNGKGDNGQMVTSITEYKVHGEAVTKNGVKYEDDTVIKTGLVVVNDGNKLKIKVPEIYFDPNAATFDRISKEQIESNNRVIEFMADALNQYPKYKVTVEGHANNVSGTEEEEEEELVPLSQERAEAVMELLIEKGTEESRLSAVGKGGREPVASGDEAWRNRRVEFILDK